MKAPAFVPFLYVLIYLDKEIHYWFSAELRSETFGYVEGFSKVSFSKIVEGPVANRNNAAPTVPGFNYLSLLG